MSSNSLITVFQEIARSLIEDYIASSEDFFIKTRSEFFQKYYRVSELREGEKKGFLFIDAGFKRYELDVAYILPLQIGGLYRSEDNELVGVDKVLNYPPVDFMILYSSRKRSGDRYSFKIRVKCPGRTLLFGEPGNCEEVSNKLSELVNELVLTSKDYAQKSRSPRFFAKITSYVEGLLELAYGIALRDKLAEKGYVEKDTPVIIDGSLLRWFSVRRGASVDGLDIIACILGTKPSLLIDKLGSVFGLAKSTKFTIIARSYGLFSRARRSGIGLYTSINHNSLEELRSYMKEILEKHALQSFLEETTRLVNRIVYEKHGIYVARFPVTSDYSTVFMLDLYTRKPIISVDRNGVDISIEAAKSVNERIEKTVHSLYSRRSRVVGEPPYGYPEVDSLVRFVKTTQKTIETLLLSAIGREEASTPLLQALASTLRMRYGYR
ncbi:MAG: hypothetical protein ABWW65_03950 [Thermoprotei archaeon]